MRNEPGKEALPTVDPVRELEEALLERGWARRRCAELSGQIEALARRGADAPPELDGELRHRQAALARAVERVERILRSKSGRSPGDLASASRRRP
jgi:hypothetical protein